MRCIVLGGEIRPEIINQVSAVDAQGWKAIKAQIIVARYFQNYGYKTELEFPIQYQREEGIVIDGYLDIMAWKDGRRIAIEVDRKSPRIKSIQKLEALTPSTAGQLIVLREPPVRLEG